MNHGAFCWYELATTDPAAARAFYADVVGWQAEDVPDMQYTLLKAGDARIAGLMTIPDHVRAAGVPPHWTPYIAVGDLDECVERAQAVGAALRYGPADIQGVGRFAILTDPQHAVFSLFKGIAPQPPRPLSDAPGHVGWHELRTTDQNAGFEFYAGLFGWTRAATHDMGPMGAYQMFAQDGVTRGGIMTAELGTKPAWLLYFNVKGIDRTAQRAQLAGGLILRGAQEVPGGTWVAQLRDPQGASFAIASPTR